LRSSRNPLVGVGPKSRGVVQVRLCCPFPSPLEPSKNKKKKDKKGKTKESLPSRRATLQPGPVKFCYKRWKEKEKILWKIEKPFFRRF